VLVIFILVQVQVDSEIPLYGPDGVRFRSVLLGCWLSVYGPHVLCIFAPISDGLLADQLGLV
jgi:hypothetical protein